MKFKAEDKDRIAYAVLHKGGAHRDDFLCAAFVAALYDAPITRRDAVELDLGAEVCLVLDTGQRFEPENNNFDHHQDDPRVSDECALSLWSRYVNFVDEETGERFNLHDVFAPFLWFDMTRDIDANGPFQVAKNLGISPDTLFGLSGPIERALLSMFSEQSYISPAGDSFYGALYDIGLEILSFAVRAKRGVENLVQVETQVVVYCADDDSNMNFDIYETSDIAGLSMLRRGREDEGGVTACHDDRGPGWALLRQDDDPRVDFAKCADDDRVLFAHPKGFILKTKERCSTTDLEDLVTMACVEDDSPEDEALSSETA